MVSETINIIVSYLDTHSGSILAILTIFLVVTTIYYAFWTYKMAKTMAKQLELEKRPYVGIDRDINFMVQGNGPDLKQVANETDWVQVKFLIINLGKVPVIYLVKLFLILTSVMIVS